MWTVERKKNDSEVDKHQDLKTTPHSFFNHIRMLFKLYHTATINHKIQGKINEFKVTELPFLEKRF